MSDETKRVDQTKEYAGKLKRLRNKAIKRVERRIQGLTRRECPICGYYGRFAPHGYPVRFDVLCPSCDSLERHRLLHLILERQDTVKPDDTVLHFAPEATVTAYVQPRVKSYETADLDPELADRVLNIEDLDVADNSYSLIICNHVMEHVDDRKALAELFRILKPGGTVILSTPIVHGWDETYENPDIRRGAPSVLHFGQWDHVRFYGNDFADRVRAAGFEVETHTAVEPDVRIYGLMRGDKSFFARKPAAKSPARKTPAKKPATKAAAKPRPRATGTATARKKPTAVARTKKPAPSKTRG